MITAYFNEPKYMVDVFAQSVATFKDVTIVDIGHEDWDIKAAIFVGWGSETHPHALNRKANLHVLWQTISDSRNAGPAICYFFSFSGAKIFCSVNCIGVKFRLERKDAQLKGIMEFIESLGLKADVFETPDSDAIDRQVIARACCRSEFANTLWQGRPLNE